MTSIYETIYTKLEQLGIHSYILSTSSGKSTVSGFMDLSLDVLSKHPDSITIALAHNTLVNGDVCPDPDMEIEICPSTKRAEALSFQQSFPPLYTRIYSAGEKVNRSQQRELNTFLSQWLTNALDQGHRFG